MTLQQRPIKVRNFSSFSTLFGEIVVCFVRKAHSLAYFPGTRIYPLGKFGYPQGSFLEKNNKHSEYFFFLVRCIIVKGKERSNESRK